MCKPRIGIGVGKLIPVSPIPVSVSLQTLNSTDRRK